MGAWEGGSMGGWEHWGVGLAGGSMRGGAGGWEHEGWGWRVGA